MEGNNPMKKTVCYTNFLGLSQLPLYIVIEPGVNVMSARKRTLSIDCSYYFEPAYIGDFVFTETDIAVNNKCISVISYDPDIISIDLEFIQAQFNFDYDAYSKIDRFILSVELLQDQFGLKFNFPLKRDFAIN